jgi:hypothetical protein
MMAKGKTGQLKRGGLTLRTFAEAHGAKPHALSKLLLEHGHLVAIDSPLTFEHLQLIRRALRSEKANRNTAATTSDAVGDKQKVDRLWAELYALKARYGSLLEQQEEDRAAALQFVDQGLGRLACMEESLTRLQFELEALRTYRLDGLEVSNLLWELLPRGTWDIDSIITYCRRYEGQTDETKRFDDTRLPALASIGAQHVYLGRQGWPGYVVLTFKGTERVVLECPFHGNAVYVLPANWETLTRYSKVELRTRYANRVTKIVHKTDWLDRVREALHVP